MTGINDIITVIKYSEWGNKRAAEVLRWLTKNYYCQSYWIKLNTLKKLHVLTVFCAFLYPQNRQDKTWTIITSLSWNEMKKRTCNLNKTVLIQHITNFFFVIIHMLCYIFFKYIYIAHNAVSLPRLLNETLCQSYVTFT